ncbi:MAG: hypothetical protein RSB91_11535 [Clostridia bacterium]
MQHQQLIPADMAVHPRPAEREIYRKPLSTGHLERSLSKPQKEEPLHE